MNKRIVIIVTYTLCTAVGLTVAADDDGDDD